MRRITLDKTNVANNQGGFFGGFYVRRFGGEDVPASVPGHPHYVDHMTRVNVPPVLIAFTAADGEDVEIEVLEPCYIEIKASIKHRVEGRTAAAQWDCVFAEDAMEVRQLRKIVAALRAKADPAIDVVINAAIASEPDDCYYAAKPE